MRQTMVVTGLFVTLFSVVGASQFATADEYVWARSNWGYASMNRPVSAMNNGYGGYYVPRNAYGNNYEGRPITNPTGYVIPAQPSQPAPAPKSSRWFHWRCRN